MITKMPNEYKGVYIWKDFLSLKKTNYIIAIV